jgi:putative membrane protein
MLKQELLSIWKDKKFTLSIIVMVFMPILYAGMLLWAFWDPYEKLDELPVALVNEDRGAVLDGESIQLGEELVQQLIEDQQFKFFEVSSEEAEKRLNEQEYYILIKIPENFSAHATTLLDENPSKLQIDYLPNEGFNFLSAKIGDTAIDKIRVAVNEEVAKTYAQTLFESIDQLSTGFADAADGAISLNEGAEKIKDGTADLKGYLKQLAESTVTLSDGTNQLATGLKEANDGATKLADGSNQLSVASEQLQSGASSLQQGTVQVQQGIESYTNGSIEIANKYRVIVENSEQLAAASKSISENSQALANGTQQVQQGATSLNTGIIALQQQLQQVLPSLPEEQQQLLTQTLQQLESGSAAVATGVSQIATNSSALAEGTKTFATNQQNLVAGQQQLNEALGQLTSNAPVLVKGAQDVSSGAQQLSAGTTQLTGGTNELANGAANLAAGINRAVNGSNTLADGTSTLVEKSGELADGASTLADGTDELANGTTELQEALIEASDESKITYSDETVDMTVSPVEVNKVAVNEVENYGSGFAPYFVSLGLFVGALLLTNVYPYVQPSIHPTGVFKWFGSKSFIPVIVMIGQIILMTIVLLFALGLNVESVPLLILTITIVSFTFMAIVQVMTVVLGDVGRFLALVLLIIQLTASAGTFPMELLPTFFQKVHDFMPMKYAIQAFRDVIAGTYTNYGESLTILLTIGVVSVIISFMFFVLLYKRRYSKKMA